MTNFIYDNTSPGTDKANLNPLGTGDPTKYVAADDWNTLLQALRDVQGFARGASYIGLGVQSADPTPSGISSYLWLDNTGALYINRSGVNTRVDLGAGGTITGNLNVTTLNGTVPGTMFDTVLNKTFTGGAGAEQNNINLGVLGQTTFVNCTFPVVGGMIITGFQGGVEGKIVCLKRNDDDNTHQHTLQHYDSRSTITNRLINALNGVVNLTSRGALWYRYSGGVWNQITALVNT